MPRGEQIELQDYSAKRRVNCDGDDDDDDDDHNNDDDLKRAKKRRWLDESDEMKFSHSIQFNAVPDWSSHYIAYSNLKKLIYQLEKNQHQPASGDAEPQPWIRQEDPEAVFSRALDVELEKVTSFYSLKQRELLDEVHHVLRDVGTFEASSDESAQTSYKDHGAPDVERVPALPVPAQSHATQRPESILSQGSSTEDGDSDEDGGETAALHPRQPTRLSSGARRKSMAAPPSDMYSSTQRSHSRRWRRFSNAYEDYADNGLRSSSGIMLKKRIIGLYVQLCEFKSFVQLNHTGFRKVLKKFDKTVNTKMRARYMDSHVEPAVPFQPESIKTMEDAVAKMEKAYALIVTDGDAELAKRHLRSHLREHVVWERNTVWRDLIGMERRAEAASLGHTLLGRDPEPDRIRRQGDDEGGAPTIRRELATPIGRVCLPRWLASSTMLTLLVLIGLFLALLLAPIMKRSEQQNCLALLVFVSLLWATEAIPLFVTSLLIPFLCVVLKVVDKDGRRLDSTAAAEFVFAAMWNPVIMLLLGGFTLAAALSKRKIDKRIATFVLSKAGTRPRTVVLANMFVAALASMLISNVAAPVLCFGIVEPVLRNLPSGSNMSKAIIMAIALASNIGGMLSPIASPQNIIALDIMKPAPGWGAWFFIVLPVGVLSILLIWLLLLLSFRPAKGTVIVPVRPVQDPFTGVDGFVAVVTLATIVLWCLSPQLEPVFGHMGVVAIVPIVLFFGAGLLTKEDFNNFPWTIIILAAGGIALGKAVEASGLLGTVAGEISAGVEGMGLYAVLVVFSGLTLIVATFISHTVAAVIVLPLVYDVGRNMEEPHPNLLVMADVLMCSAAMALPTSGFPNMTAIMKEDPAGQRYLQVRHFIQRGLPSSLVTMAVVLSLGYVTMRVVGM